MDGLVLNMDDGHTLRHIIQLVSVITLCVTYPQWEKNIYIFLMTSPNLNKEMLSSKPISGLFLNYTSYHLRVNSLHQKDPCFIEDMPKP